MGSIRIHNVTRQFGTQVVLDDATLELTSGEIVGLVGPNGAGKSTLFKLIAGLIEPDLGTITRTRGMPIGYLPQESEVKPGRTLHDEVAAAFADLLALEQKMHELGEKMAAREHGQALADLMAEYDRVRMQFETDGGFAFETRLNEVLGGVGFSPADYTLPVTAFSGGQRSRAALARLLLEDSQFLLLDEPTNHLDIDAVRWLEKFLAGHHGGAVIVSHDRYLLDRVAQRIVEVERGKLVSYNGNYSTYLKSRAVQRLTQERQFEKDRVYIEKERDFFARYHAAQRGKQARGRLTRLNRRLDAGEFVTQRPGQRRSLGLEFSPGEQQAATVIEVDGLSKSYGDKRLFANLGFLVETGQRLGITGPNGTGKTTLLRIVLGQTTADAGVARVDPRFDVGYYAQQADDLTPGTSVVGQVLALRPDLSETAARSLLGGFLFSGDDAFKTTEQLSGGEQSRLRLLKLILNTPDVLVLDEPTNHLDIPSREALEEALLAFPGTIVAVSHDRYFLDRIARRLLVMRPDGNTLHNGNYSTYIERLEAQRTAAEAEARQARRAEAAAEAARLKRGRSSGGSGGGGAARATTLKADPRFQKMKTDEIEALIMRQEEQVAGLSARFADPALYRDPDALAGLRAQFDALKADLAAAHAEWERRAEGT